ncbi:MAG: hypothetical protein JWL65_7218 [Gammaproteobacteria bacterium]|nr:hypothetical protein [Gammaproteobacteria bacterium]
MREKAGVGSNVLLSCIAAVSPIVSFADGQMPLVLRDNVALQRSPATPPNARDVEPGHEGVAETRGHDPAAVIRRYGTILHQEPLGAGGLTAWTVEKNGHRLVLYSTSDGQAIFAGIVWDSVTGRNLSDSVLPVVNAAASPVGMSAAIAGGALLGPYSGPIPESIKTIDSLVGIKEGHGGPSETLYVIWDPRCPYCRRAYQNTREYVKRGFTIKWIPAAALPNPDQGAALAATILQAQPAQQANLLGRVLGQHESLAAVPTEATRAALARNLQFFFAAFQNNGIGRAGVPAAFFLDRRTGQPRMMPGISETPVIEAVFGRLQ